MPIPDFQSFMLPLLCVTADGADHSRATVEGVLAKEFKLTPEDQEKRLPSGRQTVFINRIYWAKTHLVKAGLLDQPQHGRFRITERGREVLKSPPPRVDLSFLIRYPEYREFRGETSVSPVTTTQMSPAQELTPEEAIDAAYSQRRDALVADLLTRIKQASPPFFEKLVVELLVTMGYGGSRSDAGNAVGKSGDEGIDGIIKEDRLGLDVIYLQAKRWERTVGRPEIQQFAGALHGQRARKGVFITTSAFSQDARDYVAKIDTKISLIDGKELASLMIDHNVGVTLERTYEIKRIDSDFFIEEE